VHHWIGAGAFDTDPKPPHVVGYLLIIILVVLFGGYGGIYRLRLRNLIEWKSPDGGMHP
jgi:hypothetical protein